MNAQEIPLGFRFYPTEEELVSFYLHNKLAGKRQEINGVIPLIKICDFEPWQLPKHAGELCNGDSEQWFFFVEAKGGRPNRTTAGGYWKATGSPSYVYSSDNRVIGVKKTMVFYQGKAPTGIKTKWKMNEYRAILEERTAWSGTSSHPIPKLHHELSLCRVYIISGCCRAFDRRPVGKVTRQEAVGLENRTRNSCPFSSPHASKIDKRNSSETSSTAKGAFFQVDDRASSKSLCF